MIKLIGCLADIMIVVLLALSPIACYISVVDGDYIGAVLMGLCFVNGVDFLSQGWRRNMYE